MQTRGVASMKQMLHFFSRSFRCFANVRKCVKESLLQQAVISTVGVSFNHHNIPSTASDRFSTSQSTVELVVANPSARWSVSTRPGFDSLTVHFWLEYLCRCTCVSACPFAHRCCLTSPFAPGGSPVAFCGNRPSPSLLVISNLAMARKRRSSFSSASTDDSGDDVPPLQKRPKPLPPAAAPPLPTNGSLSSAGISAYWSPTTIAARRKGMLTVVEAMPEPTKLKPVASNDAWAHHYALQKRCPEDMKPLHPDIPTNTSFPDKISYPAKSEGSARMVFWNINGVLNSGRSFSSDYKKSIDAKYGETVPKSIAVPTALQRYIAAEDADVVCLAETKLNEDVTEPDVYKQIPELEKRFPVSRSGKDVADRAEL